MPAASLAVALREPVAERIARRQPVAERIARRVTVALGFAEPESLAPRVTRDRPRLPTSLSLGTIHKELAGRRLWHGQSVGQR